MKIFIATLMVASAAGAAMAQEPAVQSTAPAAKVYAEAANLYGEKAKELQAQGKIIAELAAVQARSAQKNSPLSADEVNESVQTLADGNRIVRSTTSKFYRNSEGRIRREGSAATGGMFGTTYSFTPGVSIVNPVIGQKYMLDSELKTARVIEMGQGNQLTIAGSKLSGELATVAARRAKEVGDRVVQVEKLQGELRSTLSAAAPLAIQPIAGFATTINGSGQNGFVYSNGVNSKYETRNEELGTRDFEGVSAEGTRRTTTIPAGAIGNERPIEIVYERWFSKDIGMVVYSKNNDPRFGEQTYKLTNIVRSEPDPSLFEIPNAYKKVSENGTVYHVSTGLAVPKAPTGPRAVSVTSPAKVGKP